MAAAGYSNHTFANALPMIGHTDQGAAFAFGPTNPHTAGQHRQALEALGFQFGESLEAVAVIVTNTIHPLIIGVTRLSSENPKGHHIGPVSLGKSKLRSQKPDITPGFIG